ERAANQALKVPEAESSHSRESEVSGSQVQASSDAPEPPDCKGQRHHIISKLIAEALNRHRTLRGLYKARDPRFVAQAKDEESHCGYQQWHRDVDREVVEWLKNTGEATPKQFEDFLREIYSRPEMRARFPNGF
ncbi:MAG: Wall-associated protein precursor, partial [Archangium sp.]